MTFLYQLIDFLTLFNVVQSVLMYIAHLLSYLMSNCSRLCIWSNSRKAKVS